MAISEKSRKVFEYVKAHDGENITVEDIARDLDMSTRSAGGVVTAAFQNHRDADKNPAPYMERVPAEIELEDGTTKAVKFIRLTDLGRTLDLDAE